MRDTVTFHATMFQLSRFAYDLETSFIQSLLEIWIKRINFLEEHMCFSLRILGGSI